MRRRWDIIICTSESLMLEGFYFELPKLSFLLFVFLACENLCPLRTQMLYFPHIFRFTGVGVKSPAWMWISRWLMIVFFIVALMSPVKEIPQTPYFEGYATLIVVDSIDESMREKITAFIAMRPHDKIAVYIPKNIKIPLTADHDALVSMVNQLPDSTGFSTVDYTIKNFLSTEKYPWIVIFSSNSKRFVHSIPPQIETSVVPQKQWNEWIKNQNKNHRPLPILLPRPSVEYFYFYPLFFGFLAMMVYLYGRNQKGLL
ncbi:MAG: hypothetical protein ACXWB0_01895 [Sulfuricurvum sp.]